MMLNSMILVEQPRKRILCGTETSRIEPSGEVCKADRKSNRLCRAISGAFSKGWIEQLVDLLRDVYICSRYNRWCRCLCQSASSGFEFTNKYYDSLNTTRFCRNRCITSLCQVWVVIIKSKQKLFISSQIQRNQPNQLGFVTVDQRSTIPDWIVFWLSF